MTKQLFQITGLGPVSVNGCRKIFTKLPAPFIVTAAWLADQLDAPDVGDMISVGKDCTLTLIKEVKAEEPVNDNASTDAQKKSITSGESGTQLPAVFKRYQTKPFTVHAAEITEVVELRDGEGHLVGFSDLSTKTATGVIIPQVGDYWVKADGSIQHDDVCTKQEFTEMFELVED